MSDRMDQLEKEFASMEDTEVMTEDVATEVKRPKKLRKEIVNETTVRIEVLGAEGGVADYDFATLPDEIQYKLGPFGLSHKLGDSAAGKAGQEAKDAIDAVWDGLMKADWSTRAPAQKKLTKSDAEAKMANMDPEEKAAAQALLEKLGLL